MVTAVVTLDLPPPNPQHCGASSSGYPHTELTRKSWQSVPLLTGRSCGVGGEDDDAVVERTPEMRRALEFVDLDRPAADEGGSAKGGGFAPGARPAAAEGLLPHHQDSPHKAGCADGQLLATSSRKRASAGEPGDSVEPKRPRARGDIRETHGASSGGGKQLCFVAR